MAPYLLLGFFLAGLMHAFIPASLYQQHLGKPTFKSVLYATLIAIPLPLCSCGVIPTAMSLRREGASKGSVISFLIATPQTGVDSILATYSLMGLPFAIVRPIAALFTALFGGFLANTFGKEKEEQIVNKVSKNKNTAKSSFWDKLKIALHYSFVDMMEDIGRWLAVGLVIAGLITVYLPDTFFQQFANNSLLSILIVLLCAIPMYVCATGSIPIAIALMLKGLTPGAALVLLMAGPAVNVASMIVIHRVMGLRALVIYLISIISGSIAFALGIDYLFPREVFIDPLIQNSACCADAGNSFFQIGCTIFLFILLAHALYKRFFDKSMVKSCSCNGETACSTPEFLEAGMQMATLTIEGMKCNHCKANAEKAISEVQGVKQVEINLASKTAMVQGDFNLKDIVDAVEGIGFKVTDQKKMNTTTIHIEGMKCNHCKANAEKAISEVQGVEQVEINLASKAAAIQGDFNLNEVINAVESIGFKVVEKDKKNITLHIEGMKCNHCKANAEKAISEVQGVEQVEINLASKTALVEGDFDINEVIQAVESIGFKVTENQ